MKHKPRVQSRKWKGKSLGVATLLILTFSFSAVLAQESVNTSGGKASGNGGFASYSVGQVVYLTKSGTMVSVAEGVQQPYEISVINGIAEAKGINLSLTAYPNPTSDNLTLNVGHGTISNLSYQLYDMQGRLLQHEKITGHTATINTGTLVQAIYFLKVFQKNLVIRTFKILKTK